MPDDRTNQLIGVGIAATTLLGGGILLLISRQGPEGLNPRVLSVDLVEKEFGIDGADKGRIVDICGADLGSVFDWNGRTYVLYGDTFGCPVTPTSQPNWRASAVAFTTDNILADGIQMAGWLTDPNGEARVILEPDNPQAFAARLTHGVSVGNAGYLWYSNVTAIFGGGRWACNGSGVARSTDNGATWVKIPSLKWGSGNFNQVCIYKEDNFAYIFGIPCGRQGAVRLMRVPLGQIENKAAYQYLTRLNPPSWMVNAENQAVNLFPPRVGEMSVAWNEFLGRYIMMYLTDGVGGFWIEMRIAENLWGPWTHPTVVVRDSRFPFLYAPFTKDSYAVNGGRTVFFRFSRFRPDFQPYSSYWAKMELAQN
jgi:hypothetical protein